MKEVILTRGLPGSGKSTWAKSMLAEHPGVYKRINRDDLRAMLDNTQRTKGNEKFAERVRNLLIMEAINAGFSVIVDDLNLSPRHYENISALVKGLAKVEYKHFDTPLDECIANDLKRPNSVGSKFIRKMHNQFFAPTAQVLDQDESLPHAIMVDLDGTYAIIGDRSPYASDQVHLDSVNQVVHTIASRYEGKIILCSGRKSEHRAHTEAWLATNGIRYDALFMRPEADFRADNIVKLELFEQFIKNNYYIDWVLDDRNSVVDAWRSIGLVCLQVAPGDF